MTSPQVLIMSDGAEFVREIVSRWQQESDAPRLTVASQEACKQASSLRCPLAVVGPVRSGSAALSITAFPVRASICAVVEPAMLHSVRNRHRDWLLIPEQPGWPEVLLAITREVLRRTDAEARAESAERTGVVGKQLAFLGGALVEERPALVNALTSLVGNADLLLLSEQMLSGKAAEQARTIHAMALRLNDSLQRLFVLASKAPSPARDFQLTREGMSLRDLDDAIRAEGDRDECGALTKRAFFD